MHKLYRENPTNDAIKQEFINYRNHVNHLTRLAKINYYKQEINKNLNSTKHLWKTIKNISVPAKDNEVQQIMTETNVLTSDDLIIANTFNNYYANVGKELASKINKPQSTPPTRQISQHSIYLEPTDKNEIINIIKTLKVRKAPGIDGIKTETLHEICDEIALPLTFLVNRIIDTGICPSEFKTAVIKPIFKKGDKNIPSNYRPISLITSLAKIFEKIIKVRMVKFIEKYKLISDKQFGFREGKSTQDAISCLTSEIYKNMDEGNPSLCIFLDLAKAFDTVSHKRLLEALQDIGIRGNAHKLISSYLTQRKQYVKIRTKTSSEKVVEYGIPQGTVLGPLLFTIYLNNLLTMKTSGMIISFADDTAIYYKDQTWVDLKNNVENDMKLIIDWFNHNILTINFEKTKFIPFACYKNNLPKFQSLKINNISESIEIMSADHIKYLGVTIDKHLRWDVHVRNVSRTLRSILYNFKYFNKIVDTRHMRIIYFALVESRLQYAILGWGGVATTHLKKLDILQKRFLKIMYNKENTYPSDLLFIESKILDVRQLYFCSIVNYIYKNKTDLQYIDHPYSTRNKINLQVKTTMSEKTIGKRSHTYLCSRVYNFLPEQQKTQINDIKSLGLFKKKIKIYVLSIDRIIIHNLIVPRSY